MEAASVSRKRDIQVRPNPVVARMKRPRDYGSSSAQSPTARRETDSLCHRQGHSPSPNRRDWRYLYHSPIESDLLFSAVETNNLASEISEYLVLPSSHLGELARGELGNEDIPLTRAISTCSGHRDCPGAARRKCRRRGDVAAVIEMHLLVAHVHDEIDFRFTSP